MFVEDKSLNPGIRTERFSRDLDGLIEWLETQDGNTEYYHMSPFDCLICRFASAITGRTVHFTEAWDMGLVDKPIPKPLTHVAYPYWGTKETSTESTYAGALLRARALKARHG